MPPVVLKALEWLGQEFIAQHGREAVPGDPGFPNLAPGARALIALLDSKDP
jgi:hypothetical protein